MQTKYNRHSEFIEGKQLLEVMDIEDRQDLLSRCQYASSIVSQLDNIYSPKRWENAIVIITGMAGGGMEASLTPNTPAGRQEVEEYLKHHYRVQTAYD